MDLSGCPSRKNCPLSARWRSSPSGTLFLAVYSDKNCALFEIVGGQDTRSWDEQRGDYGENSNRDKHDIGGPQRGRMGDFTPIRVGRP